VPEDGIIEEREEGVGDLYIEIADEGGAEPGGEEIDGLSWNDRKAGEEHPPNGGVAQHSTELGHTDETGLPNSRVGAGGAMTG